MVGSLLRKVAKSPLSPVSEPIPAVVWPSVNTHKVAQTPLGSVQTAEEWTGKAPSTSGRPNQALYFAEHKTARTLKGKSRQGRRLQRSLRTTECTT